MLKVDMNLSKMGKISNVCLNKKVILTTGCKNKKSELNILLKANCNDTIDKTKILTIIALISS